MRLAYEYFRVQTLELRRLPAYVVPTVGFPAMFFAFFAAPRTAEVEVANVLTASFMAFAVLGVMFFQFGVGIAAQRHSLLGNCICVRCPRVRSRGSRDGFCRHWYSPQPRAGS